MDIIRPVLSVGLCGDGLMLVHVQQDPRVTCGRGDVTLALSRDQVAALLSALPPEARSSATAIIRDQAGIIAKAAAVAVANAASARVIRDAVQAVMEAAEAVPS